MDRLKPCNLSRFTVITDTMKLPELIKHSSLQSKLLLVIISLVLVLLMAFSLFTSSILDNSLREQIGSRALQVSRTVANSPVVIDNLIKPNQARLQNYAETVRQVTGASFVVIGDKQGIRMAHPKADRIGKSMMGGDNDRALKQGESYVSQAKGSLGISLRGKTAVKDFQGHIIGVVSVGYLLTEINDKINDYQNKFLWFILLLLVLGSLFATFIAYTFKKAIFGLEPAEIADLLVQKQATLEAVREGIIAINREGRITTINQAALNYLRIDQERTYLQTPLRDLIPNSGLVSVLKKQKPNLDVTFIYNGRQFIGNRLPVFANNNLVGAVSSFRPQDEIDELYESLNKLQQYSELLRVQTHEYANRLHTISGLIQLDAKDEALDLIFKETTGYQELTQFLAGAVRHPILAGMIIGKYNRAKELGVVLNIDREGSMQEIPDTIDHRDIVTIVGNLIDNAFEAALAHNKHNAHVGLSFTDIGNDLVFEIEDNGAGIAPEFIDKIFDAKFTTKPEKGHGVGLMLVNERLKRLQGEISIDSITAKQARDNPTQMSKTIICVYIPKQRVRNHLPKL